MKSLMPIETLAVCQQKEWGKALRGDKLANKYVILDAEGKELYVAQEEGGSSFLRWFLNALRPFEIYVRTLNDHIIMKVRRPFRFYFHELKIFDPNNTHLGTIKRRFSLFHCIYSAIDTKGNPAFELRGPLVHPRTFAIKDESKSYGKITKEWKGTLLESFCGSGNFGVIFPTNWPAERKALFLGSVFLIDFVHFEKTEME